MIYSYNTSNGGGEGLLGKQSTKQQRLPFSSLTAGNDNANDNDNNVNDDDDDDVTVDDDDDDADITELN